MPPADTRRVDDDRINGWWTPAEALRRHPNLRDAELVWTSYEPPSTSWDHDHCAFCWQKITDDPNANDAIPDAYTDDVPKPAAPDLGPAYEPAPAGTKTWVCSTCADAYRSVFNWRTGGGPGDSRLTGRE